jgi:hypothetical protein
LSYADPFIGYPAFNNRTTSGFPRKTTAGMTGVTRTLMMTYLGFARDQVPSRGRQVLSLRHCSRMLIEQSLWILFSLLDTAAAYFLSTLVGINPPPITENCFYLAHLPFMILAGIFLAPFTEGALHKKNVVQTFRSAVSAGLKSCTTLKKNAAYL